MSWADNLHQASFRGVPFGVQTETTQGGRRQAIHEYPYRDTPWPEDMGKAARHNQVVGFLLENDAIYGGGDVLVQRDQMLAACEASGPGTLVHPTLGTLTVSLLEFAITQKWDAGRYFELSLSFVEAGGRIYPSVAVSTGQAVLTAATSCDTVSLAAFVARLVALALFPAELVARVVSTINTWTSIVSDLADDATRLYNTVGTLQGSYGRFFGGANRGGLTKSSSITVSSTATVTSLIAADVAARAVIATAVSSLTAAAAALSVNTGTAMATAVQTVVAALYSATADPADGIRLMSSLAAFTPAVPTTISVIGTAMATGQDATGDLCRRAAVVAAARAAQAYQLSSSDEAVTVRDTVVALIDAEIDIAGDQAEDDTYSALRTLRQTVVTDLNTRAATLPSMRTVTVGALLPAPVLAQRLYKDSTRADELVSEADPPHPAFMPVTFRALAS
ncbi:DNA circularization N-terminal domain-containing protein [Telmatospirillum sp.]|uniref:DNA circularization protein n=1 Tax=Telmatospirillum sp. TaxID=2079197 RepID=UPI002851BA2E|nr:DNA circularization N-terminal domain-containing protein [Telmatospirillum sp.]MDR3438948.1 DNA circularization N-terminal domain-containing protein [Telmatospirillum sp.]